jgi:hypothetical protein
MTHITTSRFPA